VALVAVYPKPVYCSLKEEINPSPRRVLFRSLSFTYTSLTYNFLPTYSLEIATLSFHCLPATLLFVKILLCLVWVEGLFLRHRIEISKKASLFTLTASLFT